MYEEFFGLRERPFAAAPQAERYFPAAAAEAALQTLTRGIERCEGVGLLVGPSGSGKTLLLQVLAERFRSRFGVALITNTHLTTRRELLQAMLFELGLPYRGLEEGELRLSLIDHLSRSAISADGMLLLLDEANKLPLRLLEEVRMITNLVRQGQPRVRLVLAGGASLEERLASPKLESFTQRIRARCYLESLSEAETIEYVRAQLSGLGGEPDAIFTADALRKVHQATDGIPRLINQVCDHALVLAFAGGKKPIDGAGLEAAWADLQQLPTPWNETRHQQLAAAPSQSAAPLADPKPRDDSFIEYGSLDEAEQESVRVELNPPLYTPAIDEEQEQAEADFQPMSSVKPEVELDFRNQTNPFAESFEEEEVVFDRYSAADPGLKARKSVYSVEGSRLSALLDPFLQAAKPKLAITDDADCEATEGEDVDLEAIEEAEYLAAQAKHAAPTPLHDPQAAWLDPVADPVMPEPKRAIPLSQIATPQVRASAPSSVAPHVAPRVEPTPSSIGAGHEVIIIEEDTDTAEWTTHRPPLARRQEYRQLFVKLRGDK